MGFSTFLVFALPYIQDKIHETKIAYLSFQSDEVPAVFYLKLETLDIFSASKPIDISIHTGAVSPKIRTIQLSFEGASVYFPGDFNFSDPSFFEEQFEEFQELIGSNIVHLERNSLTTFAGTIQNLTYTTGGDFDIGITITDQDGRVIGYGMGNRDYALKNAIKISPPEALIQLRNSRLTTGLTYTAIGLTLIAVGLTGLIGLLTRLFTG
jgi:hypothetical protein